jgi:hypothetical protein
MKKYLYILILSVVGLKAGAQVAWIEPMPTDVTKKVRIYVDLSKTTNKSLDTVAGPYYIWTWSPKELPAGDPLVNGLGSTPWKNSNDSLVMQRDSTKGTRVWYYEMIPTKFYKVPAGEVYNKGISFLVKAKDGGGYGAPDLKTEDLSVKPEAPKTERDTLYTLPGKFIQNEIVTIYYNNPIERRATMQNLPEDEALLHIVASLSDGSIIERTKFFQLQNDPGLQMKKLSNGQFKLTMVLNEFLNLKPTDIVKKITCTVRKKNYMGTEDQSAHKVTFVVGCP